MSEAAAQAREAIPLARYSSRLSSGPSTAVLRYCDSWDSVGLVMDSAAYDQNDSSVDRWKKQFKQLLEDTGYVTPGKLLSEVRVLFMGRECFEALSEDDCHYIYDKHQKELMEKAKHNFQVRECSFVTV